MTRFFGITLFFNVLNCNTMTNFSVCILVVFDNFALKCFLEYFHENHSTLKPLSEKKCAEYF